MAEQVNERDLIFVEKILGKVGGEYRWRALFRKRAILTLTREPICGPVVGLYRPQKRLSKILYGCLGILAKARVPVFWWGRIFYFCEDENSLIRKLETQVDGKIVSLLIGNPVQPQRRFLGVIDRGDKQGHSVVKAGFTEQACHAISAEITLLRKFGGKISGVPSLVKVLEDPDDCYRAFVLEFIDGRKATEAQALTQLEHWLQEGTRQLCEFSEWPQITEQWRRAGFTDTAFGKSAAISLTPALVQGDYAPWNLLVDADGEFWALDWEAGMASGIPALDWIHYLFQVERLINGRDVTTAIQNIKIRLHAADSKKFLELSGWGEEIRWLLMVYFATNWLIEDEERPILLGIVLEAFPPDLAQIQSA